MQTLPPGNDPDVAGRMLPLEKYLELAREIVRPHRKSPRARTEEAVGVVASGMMRADWGYTGQRGLSQDGWRQVCGRLKLRDYLRQKGKREPLDAEGPSTEGSPVEAAIRNEERAAGTRRLREMMGRLEPHQARIVSLRYLDGLKPREISSRTGLASNVVSKRIGRAIEKMRTACS